MANLPSDSEIEQRVARIRQRENGGDLELFGTSGADPVELVPPDPAWPARFAEIRRRLAEALGEAALRIDHVGSTAIPALSAKPVIDVQVSVIDIDDEASFRPAIETLGWQP